MLKLPDLATAMAPVNLFSERTAIHAPRIAEVLVAGMGIVTAHVVKTAIPAKLTAEPFVQPFAGTAYATQGSLQSPAHQIAPNAAT